MTEEQSVARRIAQKLGFLTENHKGLLGGIRVDLRLRMSAFVDLVADVGNGAEDGKIDQTPCPLDCSPKLARLLGWG